MRLEVQCKLAAGVPWLVLGLVDGQYAADGRPHVCLHAGAEPTVAYELPASAKSMWLAVLVGKVSSTTKEVRYWMPVLGAVVLPAANKFTTRVRFRAADNCETLLPLFGLRVEGGCQSAAHLLNSHKPIVVGSMELPMAALLPAGDVVRIEDYLRGMAAPVATENARAVVHTLEELAVRLMLPPGYRDVDLVASVVTLLQRLLFAYRDDFGFDGRLQKLCHGGEQMGIVTPSLPTMHAPTASFDWPPAATTTIGPAGGTLKPTMLPPSGDCEDFVAMAAYMHALLRALHDDAPVRASRAMKVAKRTNFYGLLVTNHAHDGMHMTGAVVHARQEGGRLQVEWAAAEAVSTFPLDAPAHLAGPNAELVEAARLDARARLEQVGLPACLPTQPATRFMWTNSRLPDVVVAVLPTNDEVVSVGGGVPWATWVSVLAQGTTRMPEADWRRHQQVRQRAWPLPPLPRALDHVLDRQAPPWAQLDAELALVTTPAPIVFDAPGPTDRAEPLTTTPRHNSWVVATLRATSRHAGLVPHRNVRCTSLQLFQDSWARVVLVAAQIPSP